MSRYMGYFRTGCEYLCRERENFNTRIGSNKDFIDFDDVKYTPVRDDYILDNETCVFPMRNHIDETIGPKAYVDRFIEMCKTAQMRVLNGRTLGDSVGKYTCHRYNGSSTVDFAIAHSSLISQTRYFQIHDMLGAISDHCPFTVAIQVDNNESARNVPEFLDSAVDKISWSDESKEIFQNDLKNGENLKKIEYFENCDLYGDLDKCVGDFSEFLVGLAKRAGKVLRGKRKGVNKNNGKKKKWFDNDCIFMKRELMKMGKDLVQNPKNSVLRGRFFTMKRDYKKVIRNKERMYKKDLFQKLEELSERNPKGYWALLDELRDKKSKRSECNGPISADEWVQHYKKLYSIAPTTEAELNTVDQEILHFEKEQFFSELDFVITEKELMNAVKKLKKGKSAGLDGITNEVIKASVPYCVKFYLKLFNSILNSGSFPVQWSKGLIVNLHKAGPRDNPGNYRGITLFSCLEKLFSSILNNRLEAFINDKGKLSETQIGFRKKSRTSDHLFIIKTLMDKYILKEKKPIYACFVDFRKAYDTIWHKGLFLKLLKYGVRGKFYEVIKKLYSSSESCIKMQNGISKSFLCKSGVKQGEPLSPMLFNLYVNDLSSILNDVNSDAPVLGDSKISHLLYADDLLLLALTPNGLQKSLDALSHYCEKWKLNINIEKTKVLKFWKCGRECEKSFTINDKVIENVQRYKYLGIVIASSGTFLYAKMNIVDRARKAMFKLKSCISSGEIPPKLGLRMFDQLIKPICSYGSEIWMSENLVRNKVFRDKWGIEKYFYEQAVEVVNTSFCKYLLGVNRKAGNLAVKSELGRLPIAVGMLVQCFNFQRHLINTENSILKEAVKESQHLASDNKFSWFLFFKQISDKAGVNNQMSSEEIKEKLKMNYIEYWKEEFVKKYQQNESGKFRTYVLFKCHFEFEPYLQQIRDFKVRQSLSKFRLSNHNLPIERGRYCKPMTPKDERYCQECLNTSKKMVVGDELHFLLECPHIEKQRGEFLDDIKRKNPQVTKLNNKNLFIFLMTAENYIIAKVANFVSKCLPKSSRV